MFAGGFPGGETSSDGRVIVLDPQDIGWHYFQKAFLGATGLDLGQYRPAQMRRRVTSVAASAGETLDSLAARLESGPVLASVTLHQIAIHTTQLFRDHDCWLDLQENILPELSSHGNELRVWCAGCSNGAEAYSLASLLESSAIPGKILATDIDAIILEQAVRGKFTQAQGRQARHFLPPSHFERKSDGYQARAILGRRIAFARHNVLSDPPDLGLDLICCRNVAIYLKEAACDRLYANGSRALRTGGYLFVGATERLFDMADLGFQSVSPCFYRKVGF